MNEFKPLEARRATARHLETTGHSPARQRRAAATLVLAGRAWARWLFGPPAPITACSMAGSPTARPPKSSPPWTTPRCPTKSAPAAARSSSPPTRSISCACNWPARASRDGDGVGFEIFDKPNFGISDFVQRANYTPRGAGRTGRTISQLDEVESARVMIVLPENRLLLDKDKHATASVFVRVRGNSQLAAASHQLHPLPRRQFRRGPQAQPCHRRG